MSSTSSIEEAQKRARTLTNSNCKQKKITNPPQKEEDDTNWQTTLSKYQSTALVVERLR